MAPMAVSTASARDRAEPVTVLDIDLRLDPAVPSGTFEWDEPSSSAGTSTGWHRHPYHQVEYAFAGVAEVETAAGRYLLPPQQAIWIPAGLPHFTRLHDVHSISLFLDPELVPTPDDRARVLAAAPVVRAMLVHGTRWPIGRVGPDPEADRYFEVLASLVLDWLAHETPLHLPTTTDPLVRAVLEYTDAHLATVTTRAVCHAVGLSERTLRRRMADEIDMTWQAYVTQSRLQRAAALLASSGATVLDVATAVGFEHPSSFTRAFRRWIGETPSRYQARTRANN